MGSVAGVQVFVSGSWFLVAALISVVMAPAAERVRPGLGPWSYLAGFAFAVLLYLSVLLHEVAHAVVARRHGLGVSSITLHFLGGMTAVAGESRRPREELLVAAAGPVASLAIGGAAYLLWQTLPGGLVGLAVGGLAFANLFVGVLNLVPGLPLDGGRILRALVWAASGDLHRGTVVAGWGGRAAAVLALAWPLAIPAVAGGPAELLDYALAFVVAVFLWSGASAAIAEARVRRRLPDLVARRLARRTLAVPADLPLAEAVRRARDAQAGGLVTVTGSGQPTGIVSEAALLATPEDRRPWLAVSTVARGVEDGLVLPADIAGEDLVAAIRRHPSREYLLVEPDGSVYGVLATDDVTRAIGRRRS